MARSWARTHASTARACVTIDGVEIEIETFVSMAGTRMRALPRIVMKEPGAWTVVGTQHGSMAHLVHLKEVPTDDNERDRHFLWSSDCPVEAAVWLDDPEVRGCWARLLSAAPYTDDAVEAFARELTRLARLRRTFRDSVETPVGTQG